MQKAIIETKLKLKKKKKKQEIPDFKKGPSAFTCYARNVIFFVIWVKYKAGHTSCSRCIP